MVVRRGPPKTEESKPRSRIPPPPVVVPAPVLPPAAPGPAPRPRFRPPRPRRSADGGLRPRAGFALGLDGTDRNRLL